MAPLRLPRGLPPVFEFCNHCGAVLRPGAQQRHHRSSPSWDDFGSTHGSASGNTACNIVPKYQCSFSAKHLHASQRRLPLGPKDSLQSDIGGSQAWITRPHDYGRLGICWMIAELSQDFSASLNDRCFTTTALHLAGVPWLDGQQGTPFCGGSAASSRVPRIQLAVHWLLLAGVLLATSKARTTVRVLKMHWLFPKCTNCW